ncbi:lysophospholipase L1-like esterase [Kushneria sinocarnis]|uniref:Lysophospholipase L1-like esterase n=1 Tax=Kushneria sinocarnis TaxID=595502 RepID=A0A420WXF3_9GAMM|nr:SGNH/GDSL hydrolase family protein [Kushneria sinocarnis]RKR04377.1 lysophospholipase L1-like esterase [Kushneria sinocarnis]
MRRLLCFGDSNTFGSVPMQRADDTARFDAATRWPGVLADCLGSQWQVIEEGLPSRTTTLDDPVEGRRLNGLARLPGRLKRHAPLDRVVLALGTNDLKAPFARTPGQIAAGAGALIECVQREGSGPADEPPQVLLVIPPPVLPSPLFGELFAGAVEKSRHWQAPFVAEAERHHVSLLDAEEFITSSPVDGIHWEAGMHRRLGEAVARWIREGA